MVGSGDRKAELERDDKNGGTGTEKGTRAVMIQKRDSAGPGH